MARSLLTLNDVSKEDVNSIFDRIKNLKSNIKARKEVMSLKDSVIGLLFEKPSTRTRASFEAAALRLNGKPIYMASSELQLRRGEPVKDTARILGGYMDGLVARVYDHQTVSELAEFSNIPVINGLSDLTHPTQIICDLFTVLENKGELKGLTLTYIGDGNNVCNSLLLGCALTEMNINVACPKGYEPNAEFIKNAEKIAKNTGSKINIVNDPREASNGADILYTDTWVSMGEDDQKEKKIKAFKGYQINDELINIANKDAKVMHCLPAYRGMEITEGAMEGPKSIVWEQGENKMYGAAGILDFFMVG